MGKILVIDNSSYYLPKLKELLKDHNYEVLNYKEVKFEDANKFTHIILSGGPLDFDLDKIKEEVKIILESDKPILGICYAHQIICKLFGSELIKLENPRKGNIQINIISKQDLFNELPDKVEFYEDHKYRATNLGKDLLVLAESEDGIEIIKHKNKPIYGIQFHPEVSGTQGKKLVENFLGL